MYSDRRPRDDILAFKKDIIVRRVTVLGIVGGMVAAAAVASLAARWAGRVEEPLTKNTPAKATAAQSATVSVQSRIAGSFEVYQPRAASTPVDALTALSTSPPERIVAPARSTTACAENRNALGVSRVVEIDTTGGPGFGFEQFKAHDFLAPGEIVLTFDDGPWPGNTPAVLTALAAHCVKAIFFPIGQHATWHPEILKQVAAQGHTIGSHTWSHVDLQRKSTAEAKDEIESGISAVSASAGRPIAPFFRFPALRHTPELMAYLAERNIGIFSTDLDSFDFKIKKPEQVVQSVMIKLKKLGKGIILMHDFQKSTATGLPDLLVQLKTNGYKVVQLKAKDAVATLPQYDAAVAKTQMGQTVDARPTEKIVRTISDLAN